MSCASVITIGNFDGVHVAHRAIIAEARRVADARGAAVVAITFDPHPVSILRPGVEPALLLDVDQRAQRLRDAGVDRVVVMHATPQLFSTEPAAFISDVAREHAAVAFVEGPDFRFGKDRQGDVALLAALGEAAGFSVHITPRVQVALTDQLLVPAGSSLVRKLLEAGRVADAAICLGEFYDLRGTVVRGDQRGRTIGVPTANLAPQDIAHRAVPADGVYGGYADVDGQTHPAAISVGIKPTFAGRTRVVEAHLLDYQGDLYDKKVTLRFVRFLRDQQAFASVDALAAQLKRDIAAVRTLEAQGLLGAFMPTGGAAVYCEVANMKHKGT